MGCDANARHTLWGSSENNERGESLFDFIINTNLLVCNRGSTPTFTFPSTGNFNGWQEVLDITLLTDNEIFCVENWRVSDLRSFSDHSWILFNVNLMIEAPKPYRNPKRIDWKRFSRIIRSKLSNIPYPAITSVEELDAKVETFAVRKHFPRGGMRTYLNSGS